MVFRFLLDHVRSFRFLLNVLALLSLLLAPASQAATPLSPSDAGGSWDSLRPSDIQGGGSMKLCR
jgi:hypothetical protein